MTKFCEFVKTFWFQHFPVLQLEITKAISEKKLTGFSSLAAFLVTMPIILKKWSKIPITEFKAESVGTSFKSQK